MAGKIYTILLIFGIIFDFIISIFFDIENAIYGTYFFGIMAIVIAVNMEINLLKIKNLSKQTEPETNAKKSIFLNFLKNKKFPKTLNEREKEIIAENKKLLRLFLFALVLFGLSTLLIFNY